MPAKTRFAETTTHRFSVPLGMGVVWAVLGAWAFHTASVLLSLLPVDSRLLGSLFATVVVVGSLVTLLELLHPSPDGRKHMLRDWRAQVPAPLVAVRACAIGLSIYPVASGVRSLTEMVFPTPPAVLQARIEFLGTSSVGLLVLTVVFLGPLFEELFYREALWSRLGAVGRALPSFIVCTLGFSIAHGQPAEWPALSLVALAVGTLRHCTGRWVDCWLAHASFNAVTVATVITGGLGNQSAEFSAIPFLGSLLLTGIFIVACWRSREQPR